MAKIQLLSTILTVVLLILFVVQSAAHACSFMQVVAQDGTRVTSRSMEFGVDLKQRDSFHYKKKKKIFPSGNCDCPSDCFRITISIV